MSELSFLYRGPLASCNYDCKYCPFGKRPSSREELLEDQACLRRFTQWISDHPEHRTAVLFTPWGEALIRRHYQEAIQSLSAMSHVRRVAIQTNLSCHLDWLDGVREERVALWATYHPTEADYSLFLERCRELHQRGIRFSVGVVGKKEHREVIHTLRADLPEDVYLWINAFKSAGHGYYHATDLAAFTAIDRYFPINNTRHRSLGERCSTGESVLSVDGSGDLRRCHFVSDVLGNLYRDDIASILRERPCPNATCGCHIGYVHLERLGLRSVYKEGILERIPVAMGRN